MTPATQKRLATLDPQFREYFNERAAIMEFECKLPREIAEQMAWMETSAAMLKQRISQIAINEKQKPKPLKMPRTEPILDRKMVAAGENFE